jgi:DNA invertase Pin-like site-specific DNA recombinase
VGEQAHKKAFGYVRVSTERQAEEGVSLDAQLSRITGWCTSSNQELVECFRDEGISGATVDARPGLQAALDAACAMPGSTLVVYSLSRLARNTKETIVMEERLSAARVTLVSLSEPIDLKTAVGKLIFRIMAVLAEFERDQTVERTQGIASYLRKSGKRLSGRIPYGSTLGDDGETLVADLVEAAIIDQLMQWHIGGESLRGIAGKLNAAGIKPKYGAQWGASSIQSILAAAKLKGENRGE